MLQCQILFLKIYIYLFWAVFVGSSLLRAGFFQLRRTWATLPCGVQPSHCGGFSCFRAWALGTWASVVVARRLSSSGSLTLGRRLSSCGARAQWLRCMWDLPGPGLESVFPALAGGFLTAEPPGKPSNTLILIIYMYICIYIYIYVYIINGLLDLFEKLLRIMYYKHKHIYSYTYIY